MAADIDQLDAIIDKFMDYARPGVVKLSPVHLASVIEREMIAMRDPARIRIDSQVGQDVQVMADEIELGRVFGNLFENARRYGLSPDSGVAQVVVTLTRSGPWVLVNVCDSGPGVPPQKLANLTTPFFRGDAARTHATGAGLGLAIADKAVQPHERPVRTEQRARRRPAGHHPPAPRSLNVAGAAVRRVRRRGAPAVPPRGSRWTRRGPPGPSSRPSWPSR